MKELIYNPKCYRVLFDHKECDEWVAYDWLSKVGDVFFNNKSVYIFSTDEKLKDKIKRKFRNLGADAYCEEVSAAEQKDQNTPLSVWYRERYEACLVETINEQYAEEIAAANANIKKILNK